jgi:hypothetical protein
MATSASAVRARRGACVVCSGSGGGACVRVGGSRGAQSWLQLWRSTSCAHIAHGEECHYLHIAYCLRAAGQPAACVSLSLCLRGSGPALLYVLHVL